MHLIFPLVHSIPAKSLDMFNKHFPNPYTIRYNFTTKSITHLIDMQLKHSLSFNKYICCRFNGGDYLLCVVILFHSSNFQPVVQLFKMFWNYFMNEAKRRIVSKLKGDVCIQKDSVHFDNCHCKVSARTTVRKWIVKNRFLCVSFLK